MADLQRQQQDQVLGPVLAAWLVKPSNCVGIGAAVPSTVPEEWDPPS